MIEYEVDNDQFKIFIEGGVLCFDIVHTGSEYKCTKEETQKVYEALDFKYALEAAMG